MEWISLRALETPETTSSGLFGLQHIGSQHKRIYDLAQKSDFNRSVIDFISLLTDRAAIEYFEELSSF